jgi:erythromycin esterase
MLWIANHYADHKIIVWAATMHISRDVEKAHSVDPRIPDAVFQKGSIRPMGHYVQASLKDQWYAIGFTAFEGEVGSAFGEPASKLTKPSAGSLESLIEQTGYENAFLDLSRIGTDLAWLKQPQVARPFGYVEIKAPWPELMDGLIFTKQMKRATRRQ